MENHDREICQVATTLINHYDCVYYVDCTTGSYRNLLPMKLFPNIKLPASGSDYFSDFKRIISQFIYANDIENVRHSLDKNVMQERLRDNDTSITNYRIIINENIIHMRHSEFMCQDKRHVIVCLENIEEDFQKREVTKKKFEAANRMARFDELTGIRNKNAFTEYSQTIDGRIKNGELDYPFGIILCDINDLKMLNDTRGHSFGDESIQRASRLICSIFCHSPVFRIGGDEFVIVLTERDFEIKDALLEKLREESLLNKRTATGPVVASGLAIYDPEKDFCVTDVFNRADHLMYENKKEIKLIENKQLIRDLEKIELPIDPERKKKLDALFGAMCTVSGGGYVFLCDMHCDYSRWSLSLVDDFAMPSEYMYHAGRLWQQKIHPDDLESYKEGLEAVLLTRKIAPCNLVYRAKRADGRYVTLTYRDFVLYDSDGKGDFFGGIIIPV